MPENPLAMQFLVAVGGSHFAALFLALQVVGGLLLAGFCVPLALVLLAAELYNIRAFHLTLAPGIAPALVACALGAGVRPAPRKLQRHLQREACHAGLIPHFN